MFLPRLGKLGRLVLVVNLGFLVWVLLCLTFLPYDSPSVLWIHFAAGKFATLFRSPPSAAHWLARPPAFKVNFDTDVAFIVKTGYGTQERVLVQLDALGLTVDGEAAGNTIVIADFKADIQHNGNNVVIHDVIEPVVKELALVGHGSHPRVKKYQNMTEAVAQGRHAEAEAAIKSFGWELDALKVRFGLLFGSIAQIWVPY